MLWYILIDPPKNVLPTGCRYLRGSLSGTPALLIGRLEAIRKSKLAKEIPRLCRGGSKSLTFPAVAPQAPIDETSSVSRQAHAQSPIDGRQRQSVKHGDESARCYAAAPRYRGRNCTLSSDANQKPGRVGYPRAAFRRPTHWGRASDPNSRFERLTT